MVRSAGTFSRGPSGSPWPIIGSTSQSGETCIIIGAAAVVGDVVMAATTKADALLDEDAISGTTSHLRVVEHADGTVPSIEFAGWFGIVTKAAAEDGECVVEWGPCTVQASVFGSAGKTFLIGEPLEVEFAAASTNVSGGVGTLVTADGSTKIVAKIAKEVAIGADATALAWVHFDGIYGWGQIDTDT